MARADSLARLALAYGAHQARRRIRRHRSELADLLDTYAADGIRALTADEREHHPRLVTCINCGLCALAAGRMGRTRLPDLAASYMRLYARLEDASVDIAGDSADLVAAAAACPVGLPLEEVAAVVRRLSTG